MPATPPSRRPVLAFACVGLSSVLIGAARGAAPSTHAPTPRSPASGVRRDGSDDSAAVAAAVGRFHAALAAGDSAAALALLAPDAVVVEGGEVERRAEYRAHHLGADVAFARAVPSARGPVRATVRGDAAWALSTTTAAGTFRGRAVDAAGAELMVLSREAVGWQIRAVHWSSHARRPRRAP